MRRRLCWALALLLLLTACGREGDRETGKGECVLWFAAAHGSPGSGALGSEVRPLEEREDVLQLLLSGPVSAELTSPFPAGTTGSWHVEGGTACVDLSEAYGGLSGAELTLADACIVLTLCPFDGVEQVYITVEGEPRPFRDQVLVPSDFVLDNSLAPS